MGDRRALDASDAAAPPAIELSPSMDRVVAEDEDRLLRDLARDTFDERRPDLPQAVSERFSQFDVVGRGGSATVWKAWDRRLERDVALKVFDIGNPSVDAVINEARLVSRIASDHIVHIFDVIEGPPHVLVLELVEGFNEAVQQRRLGASAMQSRPGKPRQAVEWVISVARGVQDAHHADASHRDIKPSNVMIVPGSHRAKIADFGLGAIGEGRKGTSDETFSGEIGDGAQRRRVAGTPAYMAPEQALGLPVDLSMRAAEDRRRLVAVDVFGLGALAFDLLTGHAPYAAGIAKTELALPDAERGAPDHGEMASASVELLATLARARKGDRQRLSNLRSASGRRLPRRLTTIVEKAMSLEPKERHPTARAVADDLQAWLDRRPTSIDGRLARMVLWAQRNPGVTGLLFSIVVLALVIAVSVSTLASLEKRRLKKEAEVNQLTDEAAAAQEELDRSRDEKRRAHGEAEEVRQAAEDLKNQLGRSNIDGIIMERRWRSAQGALKVEQAARSLAEKERDDFKEQRDVVTTERDNYKAERDGVTTERDRFKTERDRYKGERDDLTTERDKLTTERDKLKTERDELKAERDELKKERVGDKDALTEERRLRLAAEQERDALKQGGAAQNAAGQATEEAGAAER